MPGSDPNTGDVYYYPYVWKRQGQHGEPEKDRPCCVALRLRTGRLRDSNVFLFALSQTGVPEDGFGEEVPKEIIENIKRLDCSKPTFLVTSELNSDISDCPSFEDCEYLGTIPMTFLKPILLKVIDHIKSGAAEINRTGT